MHWISQITTTWVRISALTYLKGVSYLTSLHYLWRLLIPFSLTFAPKWLWNISHQSWLGKMLVTAFLSVIHLQLIYEPCCVHLSYWHVRIFAGDRMYQFEDTTLHNPCLLVSQTSLSRSKLLTQPIAQQSHLMGKSLLERYFTDTWKYFPTSQIVDLCVCVCNSCYH